ncbi:MAG: amidohydrolase [Candidatus Heimdallarchaeota archaeon]
MLNTAEEWLETQSQKFIGISDRIWRYAEIGLLEEKSASLLIEIFEEAGFRVKKGLANMPTAFIAAYGKGKPVIAILGEFDALPGLSQDKTPRKKPVKEGDPGHGCGHNLLGVAGLAAALAIREVIQTKNLEGTIRYYGCPAEENADAKGGLVKEGLFNDVDISLTWHPSDLNHVYSTNFQAIYSAVFKFQGRSSHAAADPFSGRSALDAVELMNVGCNYLREHIIPGGQVHYTITVGGSAPNIVPEKAEVWYFVRAPNLNQVREIYDRVVKVGKGAALMTETEMKIEFHGGSANLLPNIALENLLYRKMREIGPPSYNPNDYQFATEIHSTLEANYFDNYLATMPQDMKKEVEQLRELKLCDRVLPIVGRGITMPGSTDVGDVSWVTPLAQFGTACSVIGTPGHSWQFVAQSGMNIGHKGMLYASKVLALSALELIQNAGLVEEARREFNKKIEKTPYTSPLPDDWKPPLEHIRKTFGKKSDA